MPKVSVIIPNFNNAQYLQESIKSVLNQTLDDIEVIVVDDCSTDNSWEILQQIEKTDSRIKVIKNQENSGAGLSRNAGLDIATGEYIKFLDSDDTMDLDVLECMYNIANEQNSEIVCGYMQTVNKDGSIRKHNPLFYKRSQMLDNRRITPEILGANHPFGIVGIGDALYSRELFDNVRFPNLKWEDFATIPIIKYGVGEMIYLDKAVYNYRKHDTSTTSNDQNKKTPRVLDIVKCCDILRERMPVEYQEKMDSMEYFHVGARIMDVCQWKDCSKEDKEKIINALYRIIKIDVPNYSKNKFICYSPLMKQISESKQNTDEENINSIISKIKKFKDEPIDLSNWENSNYDIIIRAYNHFVENADLLHNSPNTDVINTEENGKEVTLPRVIVEQRLVQDFQEFYGAIEHSSDYSAEQKKNILDELYQASIQLVPNIMEHLLVPNYPNLYEYLIPEFDNLTREECMSIVENVVHSPNFQQYSISRMTEHSIKKTNLVLMDKISSFVQSFKNRVKGREFNE